MDFLTSEIKEKISEKKKRNILTSMVEFSEVWI